MRSYEESCEYLDEIVGRCVRDKAFAEAVLANPEVALKHYHLNEDEMDDFRTLQKNHRVEAAEGWAAIRSAIEGKQNRNESVSDT